MSITTVCPLCGARASVPESLVGRQVQCPRCEHVFTVNESGQAKSGYSPTATAEPPRPNALSETAETAPRTGRLGTRLRGWAPLLLSGSAFLLALTALLVALLRNPLGRGLSKYDFSSPRAAYVSETEIEMNRDLAALFELEKLHSGPQIREKLKTLEVRKEAEWKGNKILFVSYEKKGVKKYETVGFEKHAETGLWTHTYVSPFEVDKDDKTLAEQMKAWQTRGELK